MIDYKLYRYIHNWIIRNYGKPDHCEHCGCNDANTKYHWANVHEKGYDCNIDNFIQLCASCHKKYDKNDKQKKDSVYSKTYDVKLLKLKLAHFRERLKNDKIKYSVDSIKWLEKRIYKYQRLLTNLTKQK